MKIVGCDLHAKQQTIAMVDTETGEFSEKTLTHEGSEVREFYAALVGPVVVGIEATGAMRWFLELLEELGIECRVGHPAKIRAQETDRDHERHRHPPIPYHVYKLFFLCENVGGVAKTSMETDAVSFFAEDRIPPLSLERVTPEQITHLFDHYRHPEWPTSFD